MRAREGLARAVHGRLARAALRTHALSDATRQWTAQDVDGNFEACGIVGVAHTNDNAGVIEVARIHVAVRLRFAPRLAKPGVGAGVLYDLNGALQHPRLRSPNCSLAAIVNYRRGDRKPPFTQENIS